MEKMKRMNTVYDLSENLRRQKAIDTPKAWDKLSGKISRVSFRKKVWDFTRTAAAVLLPLFLLHQFVIHPMLDTMPVEAITLSSAPGIVTRVMLPDGSEAWLNAQSKLTYPVRFTGNERRVELSGEAYFKVVADRENRFNVVTPGGITVSAYGTEFNVNAYPDELTHQVTLAKGHVKVGTAHSVKKSYPWERRPF